MPALYVGTVALLTWALPWRDGGAARGWFTGDPLYHVLSGGLLALAFLMLVAVYAVNRRFTVMGP